MDPETRRIALLAGGVAAGYALLMAFNPARPSLRDGLRCVRRYPAIWAVPAGFGLCRSGFEAWMRWYEGRIIPHSPPLIVPWAGWQPVTWPEVLGPGWLPTAEGTAAVFNCVLTAFPLSALWAFLFLANWRGYQGVVRRGLQRRFGWFAGLGLHAALAVGAVAAVLKPVLFGGLTSLNLYFGAAVLLRAGEIINWLSFLFEYLLGVGVQIYLILLAYAWVRGLNFQRDDLWRFALRRFAFVVRWAMVPLLAGTLGISLPLIVASFQPFERPETLAWVKPTVQGARWFLAALLLVFCSAQILLVFHNESLRAACGDHFRLLRRHGGRVGWFVAVAALHFFALAAANAFLPAALGPWTWPAALWSLLLHPLLWSALTGWLLASWVCLFKRCESGRADTDDLVRY